MYRGAEPINILVLRTEGLFIADSSVACLPRENPSARMAGFRYGH
jgi:hypothetical protein